MDGGCREKGGVRSGREPFGHGCEVHRRRSRAGIFDAAAGHSVQANKPPLGYGRLTARRAGIAQAALYLGVPAVLATGVDHIQQYYGAGYSTVPTIGTLFFLNLVAAVVVAAGLVAPLGRVAGRYADAVRAALAVGGIALAVGSLTGLFISESSSGLFGFQEHGYRTPIALAIVAEVAATFFLVVFLIANGAGVQAGRSRSH